MGFVEEFKNRRLKRLADRASEKHGKAAKEVSDFMVRRAKRLSERFDEEPSSWITVNGNHIPLDDEEKPIGGQMKAFGDRLNWSLKGKESEPSVLEKRLQNKQRNVGDYVVLEDPKHAPEFTKSGEFAKYFSMSPTWKLSDDAPDEMKSQFEDYMNDTAHKIAMRARNPEMLNPYYKWNGEVVDKVVNVLGKNYGSTEPKFDLEIKPKQKWDVDIEDSFDDFNRKNHKNPELKDIYKKEGFDAVKREYYLAKQEMSTKNLHEIEADPGTYFGEASKRNRTYEKAMDEYVEEVGDSKLAGWLRAEDSSYKPAIVEGTLRSEKARNAALNLMYLNYQWGGGDKSFEEFLTTPIKLYRGEHGQERVEDDVFSSYTFDERMARKFAGENGSVHEIEVRPIDTLGSPRCAGEAEVMVPFWLEEKQRKHDSKFDGVGEFRTDEDPDSWITLENGEHVPLDANGSAVGGAGGWAKGRDFSGAKSNKKSGGSKAETSGDDEYLEAAKEAESAIEFWMNLSEEQQKKVGKDYKAIYERVKPMAGKASDWAEPKGKIEDMPTKLSEPSDPIKFEFLPHKAGYHSTASADADIPGLIRFYTGQEDTWSDSVLMHELGHQISDMGIGIDIMRNPGGLWGRFNKKFHVVENAMGGVEASPEESFAEMYSDFMMRPKAMKEKAPDAYAYFQKLHDDNPWLKGYIDQTKRDYEKAVERYKHRSDSADREDEEIWRTTENGKHYALETETGEVTKGNIGHENVSGRKNGRKPVDGKDISKTYTRRPDKYKFEIQDVLNQQGFDGKPRILDADEFDKAAKESGFIAQRTYAAPDQETLDAFRQSLYDGDFYVDCSGGSRYGRGMYCASVSGYDGSEDATEGIDREISSYRGENRRIIGRGKPSVDYVETFTVDPSAKFIKKREIERMFTDEWLKNRDEADAKAKEEIISKYKMSDEEKTYMFSPGDMGLKEYDSYRKKLLDGGTTDTGKTMSDLSKIHNDFVERKTDLINQNPLDKMNDIGAYAAIKGYDGITVRNAGYGCDYTVILNRTKCIFKRPDGWKRSA